MTQRRINILQKNSDCHHLILTYIHTYIHNWPLQPFSQDYGLASYTTRVVCANFIREQRDLQFNVDSERQIFEKLFHDSSIYSQSFCQKSAERKSLKKYFFVFRFDDCPGIRTQAFASKKPTHYILDHGDFYSEKANKQRHSKFALYSEQNRLIRQFMSLTSVKGSLIKD